MHQSFCLCTSDHALSSLRQPYVSNFHAPSHMFWSLVSWPVAQDQLADGSSLNRAHSRSPGHAGPTCSFVHYDRDTASSSPTASYHRNTPVVTSGAHHDAATDDHPATSATPGELSSYISCSNYKKRLDRVINLLFFYVSSRSAFNIVKRN